jgi:hypothetical protein
MRFQCFLESKVLSVVKYGFVKGIAPPPLVPRNRDRLAGSVPICHQSAFFRVALKRQRGGISHGGDQIETRGGRGQIRSHRETNVLSTRERQVNRLFKSLTDDAPKSASLPK